MALNEKDNLKIKPVSGDQEDSVFSPEEMHPFEVAEALETDLIAGKTDKEVKKARRLFGANNINSEFKLSFLDSVKNQAKGLISLFLILCSVLMYLFKPQELTYLILAIIIGIIFFLNAFAEFRGSVAMRLPKKYSSLKAKVVRNGVESVIDSRTLVPGDLVILDEGSMVPADCRLVDDFGLSVLETHVGGAKHSVAKDSRFIPNEIDTLCGNMLYAGSIITSGHCSALVCRIGKDTLVRRLKSDRDSLTPDILKYVNNLCRFISILSVVACFALAAVAILAGADITQWFVCALAMGASSLCDSMISLCATVLGFGAKKMLDDGMVVKNYNGIQTLAKVNTIACGKNLAFPPKRINLTGLYFSCRSYDREKRPDENAIELLKLLLVCSDARQITAAERKQRRGLPEYKGLPLDDAIIEYFGEWGKTIGPINDQYIRLDAEYTLSGDISRLLALHNGKNTVIVRGSPENILSRCAGYTLDGSDYKLSDFTRKKILTALEDYARTNSFLLAVAVGETSAGNLRDLDVEERLIFKGFVSFSGELDPGVAESVYRCDGAGIETILNSNDAYYTALNSAKSAGIITDESQIITATQIRTCDKDLFTVNAPEYKLFLDIDDNEWLNIIDLRRKDNRVTAVTAERINELPIMQRADVSIVPESACDTLRQTSDTMLLGKGINLIADGILNAKTICRRIGALISYLPAAIIIMFTAALLSVISGAELPPLRVQDVMIGGIIFNLAFAIALAAEPRRPKNIRDVSRFYGTKPQVADFMFPILYSLGGGILLFIVSTVTESYTCTLISLTVMLFLYACSIGGHGGIFNTKRFGNRILYLCGAGAFGVIAVLMLTKLGHSVFAYGVPKVSKLVIALVLAFAYFVIAQTARYFLTPQRKRKEKAKKVKKPKKQKSSEIYVKFDDEDDTVYEEDLDFELEEKKKKEYKSQERSNDND